MSPSPLPAAGAFKFRKAARKAFNSAAIVTVAAVVSTSGGKVTECRIALGGVARLGDPRAVGGKGADRQAARPRQRRGRRTARHATTSHLLDDAYASAWYRARVTPVHIRRALIGE